MSQQANVTLPYRTPRERATQRAKQEAIDTGIALAIFVLGLLLTFVSTGDFTREAFVVFGLAVLAAVIKAVLAVALHYQRARADDAALSQ